MVVFHPSPGVVGLSDDRPESLTSTEPHAFVFYIINTIYPPRIE